MCSLTIFAPPPPSGYTTFCEFEGRLISSPSEPSDLRPFREHVTNYRKIVSKAESVRPTVSKHSLKNMFMQRDLNFWKKLLLAWHENGTIGVVGELASQDGSGVWLAQRYVACTLLSALKWVQTFNNSVYPHLMMPKEELIAEFSPAFDWLNSQIRAFAWHPQTMKCALALLDDSVKIYGYQSGIAPILKHKKQKSVTELAWRPFCASVLAVACSNGVIIWHIDPSSLVTRPSSACLSVFSHPGHTGVTSISWHPDGNLLASASPTDSCMLIWDIDQETGVPLKRVSGGGVSFLRWSPDGHRLFSATPSHLFRVWETLTWTCEKWTKLVTRVQTACWSPCGCYLLFAMLDEPVIYWLSFGPVENVAPFEIGGTKNAVPLVDLSQTVHSCAHTGEQFRVGGRVHSMTWNKTGERLAVSFTDNPTFIALFRTKLQPTLDISPCGFICSQEEESPQVMTFHDDFSSGALLTVCWTSGRISHIPMFFSSDLGSPIAYATRPRHINPSNGINNTLFST